MLCNDMTCIATLANIPMFCHSTRTHFPPSPLLLCVALYVCAVSFCCVCRYMCVCVHVYQSISISIEFYRFSSINMISCSLSPANHSFSLPASLPPSLFVRRPLLLFGLDLELCVVLCRQSANCVLPASVVIFVSVCLAKTERAQTFVCVRMSVSSFQCPCLYLLVCVCVKKWSC